METLTIADLVRQIENLDRLAKAGDWEAAAALASTLRTESIRPPGASEIEAIRSALDGIEEIRERAEWLRADLGKLLKAFEPGPK